MQFTGTGVAMVTPFDSTGKPDLAAVKRVTEHLIAGEVEFLVPMGTTGESVTLTDEEFMAFVDTVIETNNGRKPVLLGCGGSDTALVASKIERYGARFDPDGFLSASPAYNKPTQEGIYQHFKTVAAATSKPIMLYNVPGRTGSNIAAETTLRLAHDFDNIVAIKEASGDLMQGMRIIKGKPEGFAVLSGDDPFAIGQLGAGYDGVISVIGNAFPKQYSDLVRAARKGDLETAQRLQMQLLDIFPLMFKEGNPAGIKLTMNILGLIEPHVRLPLVNASESLRDEIQAVLQQAGLAGTPVA